MVNNTHFEADTLRQVAEDVAHEIRSRQLNILSSVQLMQKIETDEVDVETLTSPMNIATGFKSIQQSVHEISDLLDNFVEYMRDHENA